MIEFSDASCISIDGKVVKCDKCPNKAGYIVHNQEIQISLCTEHSPSANEPEATFVYMPPNNNKESKASDGPEIISEEWDGPVILNDTWVKNIRID